MQTLKKPARANGRETVSAVIGEICARRSRVQDFDGHARTRVVRAANDREWTLAATEPA